MPSGPAAKTKRPSKSVKKVAVQHPSSPYTYIGVFFICCAFVVTFATFWQIIYNELSYDISHIRQYTVSSKTMIPVDRSFGIVIPNIGANAKIIENVDPFDSHAYQVALTKGVAHASGTSVPGKPGNIFLFSHSSVNFYEANRYNSIFYLLTKLNPGDRILLYYKNDRYIYEVSAKKIVKPNAVQYLHASGSNKETVTLMTCWPPGTSYERLLIIANRLVQ